jgi:predicted acetyltransferase
VAQIGPVSPEDLGEFLRATGVPFAYDPTDEQLAEGADFWDPAWLTAARDGGRIVGTFGSFPFRMRVPGGELVATAGTTIVTVLPTHRRRGILTELMRGHLASALERGEVMASLWASEATIYGRFGYGIAAEDVGYRMQRHRAALIDPPDITGTTRLVDPDTAAEVFPPIFEAAHRDRPGTFLRTDTWWRRRLLRDAEWNRRGHTSQRLVVVEREGLPVGYTRWRTKATDDGLDLVVSEVTGIDADAERALWQFVLSVDLVTSIKVSHRPVDDGFPWLLRDRRAAEREIGDSLWVRPLDVVRCLTARRYAGPDDDVVLRVEDPFGPTGSRTWQVAVRDGSAEVQPTDRSADATLDIGTLGSLLMGGMGPMGLHRAGRIDASADDAFRVARLFNWPIAPWVPEVF